jgi:transcriptional regulator with XRE-family HTH domain
VGSQDLPGASRMERARIAAGLTVADVAAAMHRNPATITRWERGQHTPSRDCLIALARMYGTTPAALVEVD